MLFTTAFLTGLLGSLHCAGMCGPIAMATPTVGNTLAKKVVSKILYNFGRIITYSTMGLLPGTFGLSLKLVGIQQWVSIVSGVIIIVATLANGKLYRVVGSKRFSLFRNKATAKLLGIKSYKALFGIGLLNGLLPCGFVYIALVGAVATQSVWQGAFFMFLFGFGTMPVMLGISLAGQFIGSGARIKLQRITPIVAVIIGCLFIVRGLNLGIPYISPQASTNQQVVKACCNPTN